MKLYLHYISIYIKGIMEYKVSFVLNALGQFLVSFNVFLGMYFLFQRFDQIGSYTYPEVLLCFSITLCAYSLSEGIFRGLDTFGTTVRSGEFDRMLVRPKSPLFQVISSKLEIARITRILQSIGMLVYAVSQKTVEWSLDKVVLMLLMILGGVVVFSGIFTIYAGLCFFTLEGLEFMNVLTDGAREYGKYPLDVYGKRILKITTYLVPYACFQYYPFCYLIGSLEDKRVFFLPFCTILFLLPSILIWRVGVKRYQSSGS